jgi:hypothetical protein
MRQFSRQNQPVKIASVPLTRSKSAPPEWTRAPGEGPSRTPALPIGFDFSRIPARGKLPVGIQPKLTIGAPGDAFEQEADRVAERVMRMPDPAARSQASARLPEHPVAPAAKIQTKSLPASDNGKTTAPPVVHDVLRSPGRGDGRLLDETTRGEMERRMGADFSGVKIHTDGAAHDLGKQIGAKAFTHGEDIYFKRGNYRPQSEQGKRLLVHELAHTQQRLDRLQRQLDPQQHKTAEQINYADLASQTNDAETILEKIRECPVDQHATICTNLLTLWSDEQINGFSNDWLHLFGRELYRGTVPATLSKEYGKQKDRFWSVYVKGAQARKAKEKRDGHEPGKDYSSGTVTAEGETYLKLANHDKPALDSSKKHKVYFKKGDSVVNVEKDIDAGAAEQHMWVEVKGTGHYKKDNKEIAVPDARGWVPRRSTDMTLGLFKGLDMEDVSKKDAGKITYGTGQRIGKTSAVVLHQTDSRKAQTDLQSYEARAKNTKAPKAMHLGAQYLIGETGKSYLVVPLNEKVDHVVGKGDQDRPVAVKEPKVADATKVTKAEMKATRNEIEAFYSKLDAGNFISKDLRDYWLALADRDSQEFYDALKANAWRVNPNPTNTTSIGIELVQRHKSLYELTKFPSAYAKAQMNTIKTRIDDLVAAGKLTEQKKNEVLKTKAKQEIQESADKTKYPNQAAKLNAIESIDQNIYAELQQSGWKIGGHKIFQEAIGPEYDDPEFLEKVKDLDLSPELREQLLKTQERNLLAKELALENITFDRRKAIEDRLEALNKELFNFLSASGFEVYEDITAEQKQSMWLLVNKLVQHYDLDPNKQVVGHEDVNRKKIGEGQSQAEFIRMMTEFTNNVRLLGKLMAVAPKESKELIRKNWGDYLNIVTKLEKGTTDAKVTAFFEKFYGRVDDFNKSGALQLINVYKVAQRISTGNKAP